MRRSVRRGRLVAVCATLGATLLIAAAPAQAQMPGGPGAIDQYVEDVPTGGGKSHPTKDVPTRTSIPSGIQEQIDAQGGADASLLAEIVSSSQYGAPQRDAKGGGGSAGRMERGDAALEAAPAGVEATGVLKSAITAAEGGDGRRLLGLLAVLLGVSVATVVAVGLRQRRS